MAEFARTSYGRELLVAMERGKLAALRELVDQYAADAFRVAFRMNCSVAEAERVVQNVFLAIREEPSELDHAGSIGSLVRSAIRS